LAILTVTKLMAEEFANDKRTTVKFLNVVTKADYPKKVNRILFFLSYRKQALLSFN